MKDKTKENIQLLLENLRKFPPQGEKKEEKDDLTIQEQHFLNFWKKNLSFTVHHGSEYIEQIIEAGALMSNQQRQLAGDLVENSHTGWLGSPKVLVF